MKKYAIVGTHGVGKTHLTHKLYTDIKEEVSSKKSRMVSEVVRRCPFPINDKSSIDGGYWIVTAQIEEELVHKANGTDYLICDRGAIDPIMYLHAGKRFKESLFVHLSDFAMSWMRSYEKIVYIKADPDMTIPGDGFRATEKGFQLTVDDEFDNFFKQYEEEFMYSLIKINQKELYDDAVYENVYETLFWTY